MARYGIIDLGSNTIRLCIYEVNSPAHEPLRSKDIKTLLNYKAMAGLASHVVDGAMTKQGIRRAAKTINAHLVRASHFNCERIDIFATAVLRNCANSHQATAEIESAVGRRINILSNEEEAHLGYLGARLNQVMMCGTMVDIGGGSTELTHIKDGLDLAKVSLPQGSLSSFSSYVKGILPTKEEMKAIEDDFEQLAKAADIESYREPRLYGIGGSIRSAAKVYGDLCNEGDRFDFILPEHIDAILDLYAEDPDAFAHQALRTVPDRMHTFLPGCIIIKQVFALTHGDRLDICKNGVREGYLADRVLVKPIGAVS